MFADIELQQLQCSNQSDGSDGSNPYLWVVFLRIDDDTLAGNPPVAAEYPQDPSAPRVVVKPGMKAGDTAPIPDVVAHLAAHIRNDSVQKNVILIAALLDQHDTSWDATAAGWSAFVNTAPTAVGAQLLALQDPDPAAKQQAINEIKAQITSAVTSAIEGQLSWWDKVQIRLGWETLDRVIATAYQDWESLTASTASFTMEFANGSDDFVLDGQLLVTVDPCETQAALVREIQQAIANIEGRTKELINGQSGEPPAEVEQELDQLAGEMLQEQSKLKAAELALNTCRAEHLPVGPGPVGSEPVASAPKA
jgi:hypothetical protein